MLQYLKRLLGLGKPESPAAPASLPSADRAPQQPGSGRDRRRPEDQAVAGMPFRVPLRSWVYQLQDPSPKELARYPADLVVIDYSRDGSGEGEFRPAEIARLKQHPGGGTRKVVAYMSIGEAESYRYYWDKSWKRKDRRPAWLDEENPDWDENFKVRYWHDDWQRIILGTPNSYLDKIVAQGFDGVYLDIIDAFDYYQEARRQAPDEMVEFVRRIASHARARRPDFLVIPQNGEALLEKPEYRAIISAIAREDLFYGVEEDEKANDREETTDAIAFLELAKWDGIPVLVVEYLEDKRKIGRCQQQLEKLGFAAYYAPRDLDHLGHGPIVA
jgi:cysteinyl-tRNA synthetase